MVGRPAARRSRDGGCGREAGESGGVGGRCRQIIVDRIKRQLAAAEGYLTLNLPDRALEILQVAADWATMQFEASFLTGRDPPRPRPLPRGAQAPGGRRLAPAGRRRRRDGPRLVLQADPPARPGDRLPRAGPPRATRDEPLLHYNLACYWSLANNPAQGPRIARRSPSTSTPTSVTWSPRSPTSTRSAATPTSTASSAPPARSRRAGASRPRCTLLRDQTLETRERPDRRGARIDPGRNPAGSRRPYEERR